MDSNQLQRSLEVILEECQYVLNKYIRAMAPSANKHSFNKINYYKVIDESTSVTESNFKLMTSCISKQVQILDFQNEDNHASTKVSIFKFNHNTTKVLPLSSQKNLIIDTLITLPYNGGSTDSGKALTTVYNDIKATSECKEADNIIIYVTDGDLKGAETILKDIANDSSYSLKVVFIFVNTPVPQDFYAQYKVEERQVIHFKNFSMLERVFDELLKSKTQHKPDIDELIPSTKDVQVYLSSNSSPWPVNSYTIEIYQEKGATKITKISQFEECLIEGLTAETSYKLRACAHYSNRLISAWSEFSSFTTFSINPIVESMKDDKMVKKKHADSKNGLLTSKASDRRKMMGSNCIKIAIMGSMQHGKSALNCTAKSAFSGQYETPAKSLHNPNQTVTTEINEINIMNPPQGPINNYIKFIDTFGIRYKAKSGQDTSQNLFKDSNYGSCLGEFLSGRLPPGYQEWEKVDESKLLKHTTIDDKIHAIAFIVDVQAIKQDNQLKIVKQFLEEIIGTYGYKPLIIFTKCDETMKENLKNTKPRMKNIYDNQKLNEAIDYFINEVPIVHRSDIQLFANYIKPYDPIEEREYDKELLLFNIIENLKQRAESFIDDYFKNYAQIFLDEGEYLGNFEVKKRTDPISNYHWNLSALLKDNDHNPDGMAIKYIDKVSKKTKLLKSDTSNFGQTQIAEVLSFSEEYEYPRIILTLPSKNQSASDVTSGPSNTNMTQVPVSLTPQKVIKQLLLRMENQKDYIGFLEDVDENMKLSTLRSKIQKDCEITGFSFVGDKDESLTMLSSVVKIIEEGVYECTLRKGNAYTPQKITILDEATNKPLADIEVSNLDVDLIQMQGAIQAKIGKFDFMKVIGNSKVPANKNFVTKSKLKDLVSGIDSITKNLFVRKI